MGLVDYISGHQKQKAKKVSAYDDEFIVAKLKFISSSVNSLKLETDKSAVLFKKLLQVHDPADQTTPKFEATNNAINLASTEA